MHLTRPRRRRAATALVVSTIALAALVLLAGESSTARAGVGPGSMVRTSRWGLLGYVETELHGSVTGQPFGAVGPVNGPFPERVVRLDGRGCVLTLLAFGAAVAVAAVVARLYVREMRLPAHRCDECGYELGVAASERCPECGTVATPTDARPSRAAVLVMAATDAVGILAGVAMAAVTLVGLWMPQLVLRGSMSGQPFREDFRNGWLAWRTVSRTWPRGELHPPLEVVAVEPFRLAATVGLTLVAVGGLVLLGWSFRRRLRSRRGSSAPA